MIPCPNCQQSVEILDKHLGTLFTCPYCNAVYFIDWSGQPEIATHENEVSGDTVPQGTEPSYQAESQHPYMEETPYDFSQTLEHSAMEAPAPENFSDVTDFANSDSISGPLTYTVIIEGIESSHLMAQLKEAMTDSRFGWEVAALLAQVGSGRLLLAGLSPAKASVLINRIKYLPLKISWRQDVLSNT